MAISIQGARKSHDNDCTVYDFLCDAEDDVQNLPTQVRGAHGVAATGSTATVVTVAKGKSHKRLLTSGGVWVDYPNNIIIDCGTPATH